MAVEMKKAVFVLCILVVFMSGCASIYKMGNKTYAFRSEAEEAQLKALNESLEKCRKAHSPVAKQCVLVMPTYKWINDNWVRGIGLGVRDYIVQGLQRSTEIEYKMIQKSGLFEDCRIVQAVEGNGESGNSAQDGAFEIRGELNDKRQRVYQLSAPGGKHYRYFTQDDVYNFAVLGWDWLADEIVKLKEKE